MKTNRYSIFIILTILLVSIGAFVVTHAADVSVYPANGIFDTNKTFNVDIKIDTKGESINAAQFKLKFDPNILKVESVSKVGSIFSFWLLDPIFSNENGTIEFIGGTANGVSGGSLKTLSIVLSGKALGSSDLVFMDALITSSDGTGTNIAGDTSGASFTISSGGGGTTPTVPGAPASSVAPVPVPVPTPVQIVRAPAPAVGLPTEPKLIVALYPNQTNWYNLISNYAVTWDLPADISTVATAVNTNPNFNPTTGEGLFDSKTFPSINEDGVNYLHVRFKNANGWGPTSHYRIAIDTQPPLSFTPSFKTGLKSDEPSPIITFKTGDALSGISSYVILVNDEAPITVASLSLGDSLIGNDTESTQSFSQLKIIQTGIGYLNVRSQPNTSSSIVAKVNPGETYVYTEKNNGWYKITGLPSSSTEGWVLGQYIDLVKGDSTSTTVSDQELEYKLPVHKPGIYMITIRALDKAGNSVEARSEVEILAIETPKITSITESIIVGTTDTLAIKGTSIPNTNVIVNIEDKDKFLVLKTEVPTNENGEWSFALDRDLRVGVYMVTVEAKDARGAISYPTDAVKVTFKNKPIIVLFGWEITLMDLIIILIIAGIGSAGYYWRKEILHIARASREAIIIKRDISNMFGQIRKHLDELDQAVNSKKKPKEKALELKSHMDNVHSNLDKVEKYISKDIESLD